MHGDSGASTKCPERWQAAAERGQTALSGNLTGDSLSAGTTVDCYEFLDRMFRQAGVLDYTEGFYNGDSTLSYEQAQHNQICYLLDQIECRKGSRILDVGCGNGTLLGRGTAARCPCDGHYNFASANSILQRERAGRASARLSKYRRRLERPIRRNRGQRLDRAFRPAYGRLARPGGRDLPGLFRHLSSPDRSAIHEPQTNYHHDSLRPGAD